MRVRLKFYANSNIIVVGATSTGKTTVILEIIRKKLIEPFPPKIFYFYGAHQPFMETWNSQKDTPKIEFIEGLNLDLLNKCEQPKLMIVDDLMLEQGKDLCQHFISGSHHSQTTTIYVSHSVFLNDPCYRLLSNNAQYIILMKNKRNLSQVSRLARQILGEEYTRVLEAYKYISSQDYGSVLLSLHNKVPEDLTVVADWLTTCPSVFL